MKLVTSMSNLFNGLSSFNSDISNWNVSSVTDMYGMFVGASSFNSDISNWDVSSVTKWHVLLGNKLQPKSLSLGSQVAFEL